MLSNSMVKPIVYVSQSNNLSLKRRRIVILSGYRNPPIHSRVSKCVYAMLKLRASLFDAGPSSVPTAWVCEQIPDVL